MQFENTNNNLLDTLIKNTKKGLNDTKEVIVPFVRGGMNQFKRNLQTSKEVIFPVVRGGMTTLKSKINKYTFL